MNHPVYVKTYDAPEYHRKEILRYAGVKSDVAEINALLTECLKETENKLTFKVCYTEFPVKISGEDLDLTFTAVKSKNLAVNLKNCNRIVLFAATVGIEIDRLIARYSTVSPAKALMFQAIGAERIEELCDLFNNEVSEKYKYTRPRFSPGYGDLPIAIQRDIFTVLDCSKKIGVTLNESFLMSPSKSVTAIIGIADGCGCDVQKGCAVCNKTDCDYRIEKCR